MNELTKLLITFHESMNKLDADRKAVQLAMTENDIEKLVWNAAIDAAAEGARILHKELNPAEDLGYTSKELATWECEYDHFEVSKQSILNLKK